MADNSQTLPKYRCTVCGREDVTQEDLVRKVVSFKEMGTYGSTIRSVTVAWLCVIPRGDEDSSSCVEDDVAWQLEPRKGRPGSTRVGS